jgi:hypothetical protein
MGLPPADTITDAASAVAQLPHCDDGDDDDEHAARRMLPIKVKFAPGTTVED